MINEYSGHWLWLVLFLVAILYIIVSSKGKTRILLLICCILYSLVFLNPLVLKIFEKYEQAVFYRFNWMIPFTVLLSYVAVKIFSKTNNIIILILITFVIGGVGIYSGATSLKSSLFIKPENHYLVSDEVMEIDYIIRNRSGDDNRISVIAPYDIQRQLRLYDSSMQEVISIDSISYYLFNSPESYNYNLGKIIDLVYGKINISENEFINCFLSAPAEYLVVPIGTDPEYLNTLGFEYCGNSNMYDVYATGVDAVYDGKGRTIRIEYKNSKLRDVRGYAVVENKYDDLNNSVTSRYFDEKDNGLRLNTGYAGLISTYNNQNLLVRQMYLDENGEIFPIWDSYDGIEYEYDDNRRISKLIYLDKNYNPKESTEGICSIVYSYNEEGKKVSDQYFDIDNNKAISTNGFSKIEYKYKEGLLKSQNYYDDKGVQTKNKLGFSCLVYEYDDQNRIISETYYDNNEKLVDRVEGFTKRQWEYDERGQRINEKRNSIKELEILDSFNNSGLEVESVDVIIPGLTKRYDFVFMSDLHIVVNDGYVNEADYNIVEGRKNTFVNNKGVTSEYYWNDLVAFFNQVNIDGVLMGADIIDFASPSTISVLSNGLNSLNQKYMYIRADHDNQPYWCDEKVVKNEVDILHENIDGMQEIQEWEYDEFIIMGWDNSTSQMSETALNEAKKIVEKGKPIILLTHVPLEPLSDDSLSVLSKDAWQDRALLWGENSSYVPDEVTKEFLSMIYKEESLFKEVLCGYLHFTWDGLIDKATHQHVFSPAYEESVGLIKIHG